MTSNDENPTMMSNDDENSDGSHDSDNDDEATRSIKRRERLEQNRISARESRKRRKNMIEELQRTVITLSRENKELNERNEGLRRELIEIGTKNPGTVNIQALVSCSGGGAMADALMGGAIIAPVEGRGGSAQSVVVEPTTADNVLFNPQAAQNPILPLQQQLQPPPQTVAMATVGGFNPQQFAMMQQMMALQQAGMLPQMMGMLGMPGIANAGGVVAQPQQQQQQQQPQNQSQQQQQLQQQQQQQPPSQDGLN